MDLGSLKLTVTADAISLVVHAKPRARAGKSRVVGLFGDSLDVAVGAPPVDGAANEELLCFLAKALKLPRSQLRLLRGESSRQKLVAIETRGVLTADEVRARLEAHA